MLIDFFNENIREKKYMLYFPSVSEPRSGIKVIESSMGERYHVDLGLVKEGK